MNTFGRLAGGFVAVSGVFAMTIAPASAHECGNASKPVMAGVQIVFGDNGPVWISPGLQGRIDRGLVNLDTGEGFSGLIGIDVDGDAVADFSTYIVGPNDEIPLNAQNNGSPCHGVVHLEDFFANCLG